MFLSQRQNSQDFTRLDTQANRQLPQINNDEPINLNAPSSLHQRLISIQQRLKSVCTLLALGFLIVIVMCFVILGMTCLRDHSTLFQQNDFESQVYDIKQTNSAFKQIEGNKIVDEKSNYAEKVAKLKGRINQFQTLLNLRDQQLNRINNKPSNLESNEPKKFRIRQKVRLQMFESFKNKDSYEFTIGMNEVISNSDIEELYKEQTEWAGINRDHYEMGVRLLEVTHNVNFKGQFVFDHYNFYDSPQQKYEALKKVLEEEKKHYEQKYEISKYIKDQIGICVFTPSYNNVQNRLYLRNLDSIFQQQYQNYHLVYINDASTDGTGQYVEAYMKQNGIPPQKYTVIHHTERKGTCENIHIVAFNHCSAGEIIVTVDGDDALIGRQVFSTLNAIYRKEKIALTYGQFLIASGNNIIRGRTRIVPQSNLEKGTIRQLGSFYTGHLRTLYVDLVRKIKVQDLQYPNGTFYFTSTDVAFMTPSVEMIGTRARYLPQLLYEYRRFTGFNEPRINQVQTNPIILKQKAYQKLDELPFADNPKTKHYD